MIKLIKADLLRLFRCMAFYLGVFISILISDIFGSDYYWRNYYPFEEEINICLLGDEFDSIPIITVSALALIIPFYINRELKSRTVINKIYSGTKRTSIYLSFLSVNFITALVLYVIDTFVYIYNFAIYPFIQSGEKPEIEIILIPENFFSELLIYCAIIFVFTAIYTFICINVPSLPVKLVLCFSLVALTLRYSFIHGHQFESFIIHGENLTPPQWPFIEFLMKIRDCSLGFLLDFFVPNQLEKMVFYDKNNISQLLYLIIYDAVIVFAVGFIGIKLFKRKNFK